jgi:hypothetical protein
LDCSDIFISFLNKVAVSRIASVVIQGGREPVGQTLQSSSSLEVFLKGYTHEIANNLLFPYLEGKLIAARYVPEDRLAYGRLLLLSLYNYFEDSDLL